jgi:hypothetical protein
MGTYVRNGNRLGGLAAQILEQVLDEDGALGRLTVDVHGRIVRGGERDHVRGRGVRHGDGVI